MKIKASVMIKDDRFKLRTVEIEDAEVLRLWKNAHKEYFFHKNEITFEEQQIWAKALSERQDDHMFIIDDKTEPIGCIGARLYQESVDIYNVILGAKNYKGMHIMTNALWAVICFCNLIYKDKPIRVRVLLSNPAIKWYEKIGFNAIDYFEDHVVMQFINNNFTEKFLFNIDILLTSKKK